MDEKIKLLWEQTTETAFPREGKYASVYPDNIAAFAELLIRECARADSEANNPDHEDGIYNYTILEHFGIEE